MEVIGALVDACRLNNAPYIQRVAIVQAAGLCAATWLYAIVQRLRPGLPRLLASLPVLLVCALAPLPFNFPEDVCTVAIVAFMFPWMLCMKVLGLCLNRGPLAVVPLNWLQFVVVSLLPITPKQVLPAATKGVGRVGEDAGPPLELLMRFYAKCGLLWVLVYALTEYDLPPLAITVSYGFGLYLFLGILMDGPGALFTEFIGLAACPHFDEPYLAHSLSNFWSARWNLVAGSMLRAVLYDPVVEGRLIKVRGQSPALNHGRRALGSLLTFAGSGVVHEMVWWYVTGHVTRGYRWFLFFSLQAPAIIAETAARALARRSGHDLPQWLTRAAFWTWLLATGHDLFVHPPREDGVADAVIDNILATFQQGQKLLVQWYTTGTAP